MGNETIFESFDEDTSNKLFKKSYTIVSLFSKTISQITTFWKLGLG